MKRLLLAALLIVGCRSGIPVQTPGCKGGLLPVIDFPAPQTVQADVVAVILTGDGGWRRIDHKIAEQFLEEGIPVVGFLSNDYFETPRTPEEVACDVERVIRDAPKRWHRDRLLLVGYSRGADTLALVLPRLPEDVRRSMRLAALLNPDVQASLPKQEVRLDPRAVADAGPVLCITGEREKSSLCRALPAPATSLTWEGGHHFNGDYHAIARKILSSMR